jgi:hypothetical protein
MERGRSRRHGAGDSEQFGACPATIHERRRIFLWLHGYIRNTMVHSDMPAPEEETPFADKVQSPLLPVYA